MTTTKPHVHEALGEILSALNVTKNGKLPANMGNGSYFTAADLSNEVKNQFSEKGLILIPNEKIYHYSADQVGTRTQITIAVEGEYTIISTKDATSVTISGTGDGLALGTAVASNIASTNALKNALLRTFLVTEQSAEDAGKKGIPEEAAVTQKSAPAPKDTVTSLQNTIANEYIATEKYTGAEINARGKKISGDFMTNVDSLKKLIEELQKENRKAKVNTATGEVE